MLVDYENGVLVAQGTTPYSYLFDIWDSQKSDMENWEAMAMTQFTSFRDDNVMGSSQAWQNYVNNMKDDWDENGYLPGIDMSDVAEQYNWFALMMLKFNKKFNGVNYA